MEEDDFSASTDSEEGSLGSFDCLDVEDENIGSVSDDERCGICMKTIIDRGILDCCQDWFCFACIENWASITNFCPLCQGEFQLITCVPVYDTIGSCNAEEDSFLIDEDWSVEGKSSSLSFPSYYIDENAVICLDGDGCKIRSKSALLEEDPNLDTSIACDSCDTWYHAFCVGFDPEATSQNSWLCPRCIVDKMRENTGAISLESFNPANGGSGCMVDTSFSKMVSVSVADIGETAVVVSLVGEKYQTDNECMNLDSTLDNESNLKIGNLLSSSRASKLESSPKAISGILQNSEIQKNLDIPLFQSDCCELKKSSFGEAVYEPNGSKEFAVPPSNESFVAELPESNPCMDFHQDCDIYNGETKNKFTEDKVKYHPSYEDFLSVNEKEQDARKDASNVGVKRKPTLCSVNRHSSKDDRKVKAKTGVYAKKITATEKTEMNDSKNLESPFFSDISTENVASDIFSIVRGTPRKTTDKTSYRKGNESGLRMKKIMRRAHEDTESSIKVQKLREEIRGFVHNKPSAIFGKTFLDPKLLSAFRTAIAGSHGDPVMNKKVSPSVVRAKKPILQKGSIREKLTKKIYGTCSGRRKRAWDRECEIEFWKHRCMKSTKPEKIETLKSVLDILRGTEDNQKMSKGDGSNLILSRLYLADNSVFPRNDNITPLSTQNKEHLSKEKAKKSALDNYATKKIADSSGKKGLCGSVLSNSKANSKKETVTSGDRSDKKKWALEVLARKIGTAGKKGDFAPEKEDIAPTKGNYPLLIQLPVNMRPVLAPTCHNKIPTSVRQAQLYRLTEHLLRKANLPVISQIGVAESVVADAIKIEKEVAERSNSKLVYVNLCSQEISHRSTHMTSMKEAMERNPSLPIPVSQDKLEEESIKISSEFDPLVQESLKKAGLLFNSPPGSPIQAINTNEEAKSMFKIDSNPKLELKVEESKDKDSEVGDLQTLKSDLVGKVENCEVVAECDGSGSQNKEPLFHKLSDGTSKDLCEFVDPAVSSKRTESSESKNCGENQKPLSVGSNSSAQEKSPRDTAKKRISSSKIDQNFKGGGSAVYKKVEAYIKEHIRPLCRSGVITVEQYKFSVAKASSKVMKYHAKDKNANFLIKEGEKVKKLAEQYVEASQHLKKDPNIADRRLRQKPSILLQQAMEPEMKEKIEQSVLGILKDADMATVTEFNVRKLASKELGFDLSTPDRKLFVREVVETFLKNLPDDHAHVEPEKQQKEVKSDLVEEEKPDLLEEEGEDQKAEEDQTKPLGTKEYNDQGDLILCKITNTKNVTLQEFRGKTLISIREFYTKDGKEYPGKGISLSREQWSAFKESVPAVEEAIKKIQQS